MKKLILLLVLIPILDLYILIKASQTVGFWPTLIFLILAGVAGYYLAKTQGKSILRSITKEIRQGNVPGNEILTGLCILIGGLLLFFPGIVTDILGITLILPGTRNYYKRYIRKKIERIINKGYTNIIIRW